MHHVFWLSKPLAGLGRIWNHYLLTMLTWNRRDSTPLSAAPRVPNGDQERIVREIHYNKCVSFWWVCIYRSGSESVCFLGIFIGKSFQTIVFVFIFLKRLVLSTNFKNDFPGWIIYMPRNREHLTKAGGYSGRNVVKKKMKTIIRKLLLIKILKLRLRNLDN